MKHNKKKNIAIIFDLLLKEYYSENDINRKTLLESIIFKYFNKNSVLLKEYNLYNVLSSIRGMNEKDSERYLSNIKEEFNKLDRQNIEKNINLLKEDISKNLGKEFYDKFTPNYKVYATIFGLLNETYETAHEKFELENKILDLMRMQEIQPKAYILEHSDIIIYNQYCKKFNEKYSTLLECQKKLIYEFINSENVDLMITLNEELSNCKNILIEFKKQQKDSKVLEKINLTLEQINEFKNKKQLIEEDFEFILELQEVCYDINGNK